MAAGADRQSRPWTFFDLIASLTALGAYCVVVGSAIQTHYAGIILAAVVLGLVLIPVTFVAASCAMIGAIIAVLWLFSLDRDYVTDDPIFPAHWWDFRPLLAIGLAAAFWAMLALPVTRQLTWKGRNDWSVALLVNGVPIGMTILAARRWLPFSIGLPTPESWAEISQPPTPDDEAAAEGGADDRVVNP